jgi:predicted nucleic acid-binding protein
MADCVTGVAGSSLPVDYPALRSRGHTVRKTIDCLIATFCLRGQHSLVHRDRDFDPCETFLELPVIHP